MAATPEEVQNLAEFKATYNSTTKGIPGKKHDGDLYKEAKWANSNSASLVNDFAAGKAGVRHEGRLYGMLRRTEANTAVIPQLVGAIKAVSGGEAFDEAKLLASIARVTKESFDAALKDAAPAAVTLQVEAQESPEQEEVKA